jgi:DNA-directed RNA polymerase specialized sigma24 family protein
VADQALNAFYAQHYPAVFRLAVLLTGDVAAAEQIADDAFADLHGSSRRLRDDDRGLTYLRRRVASGARHYRARRARSPRYLSGVAPAGRCGLAAEESLLVALRALPGRQGEALVLRYYADLPYAQVASALGISDRSARASVRRGMAALQAALDGRPPAAGPLAGRNGEHRRR